MKFPLQHSPALHNTPSPPMSEGVRKHGTHSCGPQAGAHRPTMPEQDRAGKGLPPQPRAGDMAAGIGRAPQELAGQVTGLSVGPPSAQPCVGKQWARPSRSGVAGARTGAGRPQVGLLRAVKAYLCLQGFIFFKSKSWGGGGGCFFF